MTRYANKTTVSVDRSMIEVRKVLTKHKTAAIAIAESEEAAAVQFIFETKPYKFVIKYPSKDDNSMKIDGNKHRRSATRIQKAIEDEKKRLWRAMVLYIKAALEAHANGLVDLKRSMLGNMMLPSGKTIYEQIGSDIDKFEANPQLLLQ